MDYSPPGSSIPGILWAGILEWAATSSSMGSFPTRDRTGLSCIAGGFFIIWAAREVPWEGRDPACLELTLVLSVFHISGSRGTWLWGVCLHCSMFLCFFQSQSKGKNDWKDKSSWHWSVLMNGNCTVQTVQSLRPEVILSRDRLNLGCHNRQR